MSTEDISLAPGGRTVLDPGADFPYIYDMHMPIPEPPRSVRMVSRERFATVAAAAALTICLVALFACSSSTDPDISLAISFTPAEQYLSVQIGDEILFGVEVSSGHEASVRYQQGDEILSEESSYLYVASRAGRDTLRVTVTASDTVHVRDWRIDVGADPEDLPPLMQITFLEHGRLPTSIVVNWNQPGAEQTPYELVEFLVAVSYTERINDNNWDQAVQLGAIAYDAERIAYAAEFDADDGLEPDRQAWFALRARDIHNLYSPLWGSSNAQVRISAPYYLEGYVRDTALVGVPDAIVSYGCDTCKTTTDPDGSFRLGPFRDFDKFVLSTTTRDANSQPDIVDAYYDTYTDSMSIDTEMPLDIFVIGRYGLDTPCAEGSYDDDYLALLRSMTYTDQQQISDFRLLKWPSYPISVFINDEQSTNGVELVPQAQWAIELWNEAMGRDVLVEVSEPGDAQVQVMYADIAPNFGSVQVVIPLNSYVNAVIPELMHLLVREDMNDALFTVELLVHEFGHTLCLGEHSTCELHIMHAFCCNRFDEVDEPVDAISIDERRILRSVINLPQATPMDRYAN